MRPFTFGDNIIISGNTGSVKELRVMHLLIESNDGSKDILISNSLVLSQIILKKRPRREDGTTSHDDNVRAIPHDSKDRGKSSYSKCSL